MAPAFDVEVERSVDLRPCEVLFGRERGQRRRYVERRERFGRAANVFARL
jgi:hypothetical protein